MGTDEERDTVMGIINEEMSPAFCITMAPMKDTWT